MARTVILRVLLWAVVFSQCLVMPTWARVDPYVSHYLKVKEPIELPLDKAGNQASFTPEQLSAGKQLFESSCLNCHVGGTTLPNPTVSLSLANLQRAKPPRDTITSLVQFQRDPLIYDGSESSAECRRVSSAWMKDSEVQNLAAFILRAAQVAPGWGTNILENEG